MNDSIKNSRTEREAGMTAPKTDRRAEREARAVNPYEDRKPFKAWIGLTLLELAVAAALIVTMVLVLGNQVNRGLGAAEIAATAFSAMKNGEQTRPAEAWELKKYYGIAEEDVEDFSLRLPVSNMDAAELCVLKCASDDAASRTVSTLKKRLDEQISLFENYGVEQMKLLTKARAFSTGPYAVLVIDEAAGDAEAAVKSFVKSSSAVQ